MNELARAIVLLCQLLEAGGVLDPKNEKVSELRAIYLTLLRRSESTAGYDQTARGSDALLAMKTATSVFPETEPPPLPQKPPEV